MEERRGIKRRTLALYLQVFDVDNDERIGYLANISPNGIMLLSEKPIQTKKEFLLEIRLSVMETALFYEEGIEKHIQFRAESRWSSNRVSPPLFSTGFMLLDLAGETLEAIDQLIDKLDLRRQQAFEETH